MAVDVNRTVARFEQMRASRSEIDARFQEINDLVRPNTLPFNQTKSPSEQRTRKIYDGTAMLAAAELAYGLQSYVINPSDRWYNFAPHVPEYLEDEDSLVWYEIVSDLTYFHLNLPRARFSPSITELFQDAVGYGNGVQYQDIDYTRQQLVFKNFPLSNVFFDEDYNGVIDTMYRYEEWTARQALQIFGEKNLPSDFKDAAEKDATKKFKFIHAVEPRTDKTYNGGNKSYAFVSCWIWLDKKVLVSESGYTTFPYNPLRWDKLAGDVYARGPAHNCMPDIKMLQAMARVILIAGEKVIDPPILVPDDGFVGPFKTVPGAIMKYDAVNTQMGDMVKPLETRGNIGIGIDLLNRVSDRVERAFFLDFLRAERKRERQTRTEIMDDRDEMLRFIAPITGRIQAEAQVNILTRAYDLLSRAGVYPPPPPKLRGTRMKIEFVSQAVRAQTGSRAMAIGQFIQDMVPLAQIDPQAIDIIDTDSAARELASARDITHRIIRRQRDVDGIRQQRQEQQSLMQGAEAGKQMASAAKDLAGAQALL